MILFGYRNAIILSVIKSFSDCSFVIINPEKEKSYLRLCTGHSAPLI